MDTTTTRQAKLQEAYRLNPGDYNVMPLRLGTKVPALASWKVRQTVRLSRLELRSLLTRNDFDCAVVTGELEETGVNVIVADVDEFGHLQQALETFGATSMIGRTRRGFHLYYQVALGRRIPNKVKFQGIFDFKNQGGCATVHE